MGDPKKLTLPPPLPPPQRKRNIDRPNFPILGLTQKKNVLLPPLYPPPPPPIIQRLVESLQKKLGPKKYIYIHNVTTY